MYPPKHFHPKKKTFLTRHHILPISRRGKNVPQNILRIWSNKHVAFHSMFGDHTLDEAILDIPIYSRYYGYGPNWKVLFGSKSREQAIELLKRVSSIKKSLKRKTIVE